MYLTVTWNSSQMCRGGGIILCVFLSAFYRAARATRREESLRLASEGGREGGGDVFVFGSGFTCWAGRCFAVENGATVTGHLVCTYLYLFCIIVILVVRVFFLVCLCLHFFVSFFCPVVLCSCMSLLSAAPSVCLSVCKVLRLLRPFK